MKGRALPFTFLLSFVAVGAANAATCEDARGNDFYTFTLNSTGGFADQAMVTLYNPNEGDATVYVSIRDLVVSGPGGSVICSFNNQLGVWDVNESPWYTCSFTVPPGQVEVVTVTGDAVETVHAFLRYSIDASVTDPLPLLAEVEYLRGGTSWAKETLLRASCR
jgi:hypothetical protein